MVKGNYALFDFLCSRGWKFADLAQDNSIDIFVFVKGSSVLRLAVDCFADDEQLEDISKRRVSKKEVGFAARLLERAV